MLTSAGTHGFAGGPASKVLVKTLVSMGALVSKTIRATERISVPVVNPDFGRRL